MHESRFIGAEEPGLAAPAASRAALAPAQSHVLALRLLGAGGMATFATVALDWSVADVSEGPG